MFPKSLNFPAAQLILFQARKSWSWEINSKSESGYWFLAIVVILSEWAKNLSVIQRIRDLGFRAKITGP